MTVQRQLRIKSWWPRWYTRLRVAWALGSMEGERRAREGWHTRPTGLRPPDTGPDWR